MSLKQSSVTLFIFLAACGGVKDPVVTDTASQTGNTNPTDECAYAVADDLPDYSVGLDEEACKDGAYYNAEVSVAHTYYVDRLHFDECGEVTGEEVWHVFVGDLMASNGFKDCVLYWEVFGSKEEALGIGDYTLLLDFHFVEGRSTCVEHTENGKSLNELEGKDFSERYDVDVQSGDATIYFDTAKQFATGSANTSHLSAVSALSCKLF